jgi:hypothetical protein
MGKFSRRAVRGVLALLLLATVAAVLAVTRTSTNAARGSDESARGDAPRGLARHLDQTLAARPTATSSEQGEDPDSAAEAAFNERAYPFGDISPAEQQTAATAFAKIKGRSAGKGKSSGTWAPIGPSQAQYPAILNRHGSQYWDSGRTTAMAIAPSCTVTTCRLWIGAAGGGIWRTDDALSGSPHWTFVSGSLGSNAFGALTYDASTGTLWAGTGEAHASGDSEAGVGVFKSTDGGTTWSSAIGASYFAYRAISSIVIDHSTNPATIYVGTTRAVRGVASVTGGGVSLYPTTPGVGLWKSTDDGGTFTLLNHSTVTLASGTTTVSFESSFGSLRGVSRIALDPSTTGTLYASAYNEGIWRSTDSGANWTQIMAPISSANSNDRTEFAVTTAAGKTRIYAAEGTATAGQGRFLRTDDATAAAPVFTTLSSSSTADTGYGSYNYCTGQCWYDNFVYTPAARPDMVYLGGSYQYAVKPDQSYNYPGNVSNGRGVVLSTDAGVSWNDMTEDATSATAPNGLHPDQHVLISNPANPNQFFEGSDGGVMRSDGTFADTSARCDLRSLSGDDLTRCRQLLSKVPSTLTSLNKGLSTIQFQSLSVNPANSKDVQGGTQDNGTFETTGSTTVWPQTIFGDGGQSGFDISNPDFRVHTYFNTTPEVNFNDGNPANWIFTGDPIVEAGAFYIPLITDPKVSGTMWAGANHVWRTTTFGIGTDPIAVVNAHCNELTGDFASGYTCGDWQSLDGLSLTSGARGDRAVSGGTISALARYTGDTSTLWAATSAGRLFISTNADDSTPGNVTFTRLDNLLSATNDPPRFISSISVDPANRYHAWITYSGYSASDPIPGVTPAEPNKPGHVFSVTYDPTANGGAGDATWTSLDGDLGDMPVNAIVRDDPTGTFYISTDFGVLKSTNGGANWVVAADGMPTVEVAGLTIVPGARKLYAATHGMSAWLLTLP